jgi:hypothetical protein
MTVPISFKPLQRAADLLATPEAFRAWLAELSPDAQAGIARHWTVNPISEFLFARVHVRCMVEWSCIAPIPTVPDRAIVTPAWVRRWMSVIAEQVFPYFPITASTCLALFDRTFPEVASHAH